MTHQVNVLSPRFLSLLIATLAAAPLTAHAWGSRQPVLPGFEIIDVPGAICGDGSQYKIYIKAGDPKKSVFHFQGGGACWNSGTCFGPAALTQLKLGSMSGVLGSWLPNNPVANHTYVYFPYCTGDFFVGDHTGVYKGKTVHHEGRRNITKALDLLKRRGTAVLPETEDVVVYGESAGALGAIVNLDQIDAAVPNATRKMVVPDSPGLHFNDDLWKRFDPAYIGSIRTGLEANGIRLDTSSGLIAREFSGFCKRHETWKVGVVQATQDVVMSAIFGNLAPQQHYFRVMGKDGILKRLEDPSDNCSAWVPESYQHVFLPGSTGWNWETWDGVSGGQFFAELYQSDFDDPHPSHH